MSLTSIFRVSTLCLLLAALVSAVLHFVLLASDSPAYRNWVLVQIAAQVLGAFILWQISKFKMAALFAFVPLSVFFAYINAVYINYGNPFLHLSVFVVFWVSYGALAKAVWSEFRTSGSMPSAV